ncbi:hypothetical protein IB267_31665 [Ensifer sp. ENS09]|uniref:hypothetical protein n=1 Tax=Ensifer sp. ENS09 TaxID=2769263 RepID=UPI001786C6FE|nr:hypothetical protein [Ensifer sp. ENS09]MBD9652926.1 hypothetical protein [Ensifer sp. ENS09]
MNKAQRDYGCHELYLPILREAMTEELFLFLRKLQSGPVDLSEALALANRSDGLVGDPRDCAMKIIEAVQCACLSRESAYQASKDRGRARERLEQRQVSLANMHLLIGQLEGDFQAIEANGSDIYRSSEQRQELVDVIRAVTEATDAVERFVEAQRRLLHDRGGNNKGFDRLFVRKMRTVWRSITGEDPGIARTPVVDFSVSVWDVFGFEPLRQRPLYPWLSERFSKIR